MRTLHCTVTMGFSLFGLSGRAWSQERAAPAGTCEWRLGPPTELRTPEGKPMYVEKAAVFEVPQGLAILGFAVVHPDPGAKATPYLGLILTRGVAHPIPYPDIEHLTRAPRFFQETNGKLHAIWGRSTEEPYGRVDEIWHSTLEGNRWSSIRRIVSLPGGDLRWEESELAPLAAQGDRFAMAVPGTLSAETAGILLLEYHGGRWQVSVPIGGRPVYAAVGFVGTTTVLAYVTSAETLAQSTQHVFTRLSRDSGRSWIDAQQPPGQRERAHYPVLVTGDFGTVLGWAEESPGEPRYQLRIAASADGTAWSSAPIPPATTLLGGMSAVIAVNGSPLILGYTPDAGLVLEGGKPSWCMSPIRFSGPVMAPPRLSRAGQRVYLSWALAPKDRSLVPITQVAELSRSH